FVSTTRLPWFAVKDEAYTSLQKLSNSPFYTLERKDRYKLVNFLYNESQSSQTRQFSVTEGFSQSQTNEFSHTVGITLGGKYGIEGVCEASVELSYSFTNTQSRTVETTTSITRDYTVNVDPRVA